MKSLLKGLLACTLMLVMVGCSGNSGAMTKEEAKTAYETSLKALAEEDSYEMTGKMSIIIDGGGMKLETSQDISAKSEGFKTDNPKMSMNTKATIFGETTEADIYFVDGLQYTNTDGTKSVIEGVDISELIASSNIASQMDLTLFDKLEATKKGDTIVFTINFTTDDILDLLKQTAQLPAEAEQIKSSEGNFEIITDSKTNQMQSMKMVFNVEMEAEGQAVKLSMDMDYKYSNYGTTKVELPSDLDTYEDGSFGNAEVQDIDLSFLDQASIIDAGEYEVGTDIEAGEYFAFAKVDGGALLAVSNDVNYDTYIHDLFFYNSMIVTLQDKQYVDAFDCVLIPVSKVISLPEGQQGMLKVGLHIQPGEYTLSSDAFGKYSIYNNSLELTEVESDFIDKDTTINLADGQYIYLEDVALSAK